MTLYVKKPEMIVAQLIDFESYDALKALYDFLSGETYTIVHTPGDRFPNIIINNASYSQGDYICRNPKTGAYYGRDGRIFEEEWEASE